MDKYSKNYLLTDDDVKHISGPGTIVINYPELYKYKSIEQLFAHGPKVIILYLTDRDDVNRMFSGHWVALTKYGNHVTHFDSYGLLPDSEIKFNKTASKRKRLNQNINYLTRLLYNYAKKGGVVEYNEYRFQKHGSSINTCGRHSALRARFYKTPLEDYQKAFINARKKGANLDDLVTQITNQFI